MTWRPSKYLLEGELDNSKPGKVTGRLRFAGMKQTVAVDLEGDFDRDIRGQKLRLTGRYFGKPLEAEDEMEGFGQRQVGTAGHITPGLDPQAYTPHPFIEWESEANGRVVLMPEAEQVTVIATVPVSAGPSSNERCSEAATEGRIWFMSWLCRLGWRPRLRPEPTIYIIENCVHWVIVVEQRPWWPVFQEPTKWQGIHPPKRLKRNRHRRAFLRPHPRYNHPY